MRVQEQQYTVDIAALKERLEVAEAEHKREKVYIYIHTYTYMTSFTHNSVVYTFALVFAGIA
jgi:hypothetical protein